MSALPKRTRDQIDVHFSVRGADPGRVDRARDWLIECQDLGEMPTMRSFHVRAIAHGYRGDLNAFVREVKLYVARDYTPVLDPRKRPEPGPGREQ